MASFDPTSSADELPSLRRTDSLDTFAMRRIHLANPGPVGFGGFATTLMTLSLSMMGIRDVSNQAVFIGDLCFISGIGLIICAQWEMVRGNTFAHTVLTAFGLYYGGYGVLLMPSMGIIESYGGKTPEYYNAFGLYLLVWSIFNTFFLLALLVVDVANIVIYGGLEISYILNCAAHFATADGKVAIGLALTKTAGVFGFIASLAGFYVVASELCQDALPFYMPLGGACHGFVTGKRNGRSNDRTPT